MKHNSIAPLRSIPRFRTSAYGAAARTAGLSKLGSVLSIAALLANPLAALAVPMTVQGDPFTLVATGPGTAQLFGLTADAQGRVYIGNNSNTTTGIPVQRFDPALFSNAAIALQNFGPAVGDADGLTFANGFIYVPDQNEGLRRIAVADESSSVFVAGAAINATGSPVVSRPSDGHIFVGFGSSIPGNPGASRIDEYDSAGTFVRSLTTTAETETMTFDPNSGLIYYAPFGTAVRSIDPVTDVDTLVGNSSGFIDGGLTLDPTTGLLFVGTANGANSGLVETIDPATGNRAAFASGFNGSLGILREPVSGDLYVLDTDQLYRLESRFLVTSVQFSSEAYSVNESAGNAVLTVTREGDARGTTVVHYATSNGTATSGADYAETSGDLVFEPGETSKTFSVPITNDLVVEGNETFSATLTEPAGSEARAGLNGAAGSGGIIGSPATATVTIADNNAEPTPTPTATPVTVQLLNISGRAAVGTNDEVSIAGFIVRGGNGKRVIARGIGPSLTVDGAPLAAAMQDPILELRGGNGELIRANDNWRGAQESEIQASGLAPTDNREAAIIATLNAGDHTAIIRGANASSGVGLVEIYDLDPTSAGELANLSVRARVLTNDNVLINGLILRGGTPRRVLFRAIGPSLANNNTAGALQNPTLDLHGPNGELLATNDDWRDAADAAEIEGSGLAPDDDRESAILLPLPPANYTSIVRGVGGTTGVALAEAYNLD